MRLLLLAVFLSLTACATYPVTVQQANSVQPTRLLTPAQAFTEAPYTGKLAITRDGGFMGSACAIRVFVDATPIVDLAPAERIELFVPLGEHIVSAASTETFCGGGVSETAVVITAERRKVLRIATGQSGDIYIQASAF